MKCYGIYYGGSSYSAGPYTNSDVREYDSMAMAKGIFEVLEHDPYYPCVDQTAEMQVFFEDPRTEDDELDGDKVLIDPGYPDRIIRFGPRNGVVVERC